MSDAQITVYTKPGCVQCRFTTKALDRDHARYTLRDVTTDAEAHARVQELGYRALPVVEVQLPDGIDHWSGYQPDKVAAAAYLTSGGAA